MFSFMALLICVVSATLFFSELLHRLCYLGDNVPVGPYFHGGVLERPSDLLHHVCRLEAGVPGGDLCILHQIMIFLYGKFLKAGPRLACHRFLVPLLQCEGL